MDLIIRAARLADGSTVDIGIRGQRIETLAANLKQQAVYEIDAAGRLTLPAFVNGQLHACKSFWRRSLTELGEEVARLPRFEAAAHVKRNYSEEDVYRRVDEVMRLAIVHGACAIRLFADVDEDAGLSALHALLRIQRKYQPLMTVQVAAFPQDGVLGAATQALMRAALSAGANVVGGIPWIESTPALQRRHTEMCFELAAEYDKDLHFVCDDVVDASVRTLETVAELTLERGFAGRVCATQCAALAAYDDEDAARVIGKIQKAGMTIFSNSHVALIATDFAPRQPWPRGITRVRELMAANVPVACAQDDVDNWFYPFGRNDMLEVAQFMAHVGQFAWQGDVDRVLPMVTSIPAKVMGLRDYGLEEGNVANLVILHAGDWHEAVQFQVPKSYVVLRGRIVARTQLETILEIDG